MIYAFSDLPMNQQTLAGGKGGTLSRLYQAGYPVPNGFIVLPSAFTKTGLKAEAWTQVQTLLAKHRASNRQVKFAVRSSATSEDSAQASFAGNFTTLLNQQSDDEIRTAIHTVFESRLAERVQAYSEAKGIQQTHEMAVVVQEMVDADYAGILFTADPVTSNRTQMVGSFVQGLGEPLVSGEVSGEQFTLYKPKGKYEGTSALKPFAPALFQLGARLEKELGKPQDIEWAIAGNTLYLLQARPITTMERFNPVTGEWNDSLTGDYLWSSTNAGEALSGVMFPLTWTTLIPILNEASPPILSGQPNFGNVGGRIYVNLTGLIVFGLRLGFKRETVVNFVKGIAGNIPDDITIPDLPYATLPLLIEATSNVFEGLYAMWKVKPLIPDFIANGFADMDAWRAQIEAATTPEQLLAVWIVRGDYYTRTTSLMTGVSAMDTFGLSAKTRDTLTKLIGLEDTMALMSGFSSAEHYIESAGLLVAIAKVHRGEMTREAYLRLYGHRTANEVDLAQPRPRENPEWLEKQLNDFKEEAFAAEKMLNERKKAHHAARQRLLQKYPLRGRYYLHKVKKWTAGAHLREQVRTRVTYLSWVLRVRSLKAGELTGLGEDVFYLTESELVDLLKGKEVKAVDYIPQRKETYQRYQSYPRYPALIQGRFSPEQWMANPERRYDVADAMVKLPASSPTTHLLKGHPGSVGVVEGLVRVLPSMTEAHTFQKGEILVASLTDVGWTPLFPRASAIITDIGAPLSHAAVVARELGLPAVVGCGDATMRLQTGDRVRVDGGQGIVEILTKGKTS